MSQERDVTLLTDTLEVPRLIYPQFLAGLFRIALQMRKEGWGDKTHGDVLAEFNRRVIELGRTLGLDIETLIELIEHLIPLILLFIELIFKREAPAI